MEHTLADAIIVAAIAVAVAAYLYFRHTERRRRLEIVHQERLAAMDKGIPLPELPLDPARLPNVSDPRVPLLHGIVWTALGLGGMVALSVAPVPEGLWPMPLPLVFLGLGLILYYVLASERPR
ncbi:MAG: DUF6249 domain-containing protein [Acidobacteriota bacterium]